MIREEFRSSLDEAVRFGADAKRAREESREASNAVGLASALVTARAAADSPDSIIPALELLLSSSDSDETSILHSVAAQIRDEECGRRMVLRGLVEFSSRCSNTCLYCGLNRNNKNADRYRLTAEEILDSAELIAKAGIRTIVLQSGEDGFGAEWLAEIIRAIKYRHDMAITLSVGERPRADFALWKEAGADRFLMRVESSTPELYASLHLGRALATRLSCLDDLRDLGYQVGSGIMIGPPGQTLVHIARDILFFSKRDFDMIGIGPFIPHPDTPFKDAPAGTVGLTLNALALSRIVTRDAWLPATTALGSLDRDYRVDALRAGANVVMPNFSPVAVKKKYEIYPGKRCVGENTGACAGCMGRLAESAGLALDYSRADSLKIPCYT